MSHVADIAQIFSSLQGEGLYAGLPMTFVRFAGCGMCCGFCDTEQTQRRQQSSSIESPPQSSNFVKISNPLSATALNNILATFSDQAISVTGGEPLEQADFLALWLPSQASKRRVLLETNGIHHAALEHVLPFVHIVSMDIKLPSSTGQRAMWDDHATFLRRLLEAGVEVYVKIVVTAGTEGHDLEQATALIAREERHIPVFLQPASPTITFNQVIPNEHLATLETLCRTYLPDVRVMPQMHKTWGLL